MFTLTEEETLLAEAAKGYVADKLPTTRLRALRDAGQTVDAPAYADMAAMGWTGAIVAEAHGGSGLGCRALGVVLEELGRTLAPAPLASNALIAASALTLGGSAAQKAAWLPRIADGSALFALAVDEGPHHAPHRTAAQVDGTGALTGAKTYVADGHLAHQLLVLARGPDGALGLYLVTADGPGVSRRTLATLDSRGAADVTFTAAPAEALTGGEGLVEAVLDRARIGVAAEMLGAATAAFELTADYLKTRTQFGQLIGAFQGLQHRAGKMLVELELTRSCVLAALSAIDDGAEPRKLAEYASLAKARAGDTLHLVTNEMVQMHGGIGMTDAHDSGLYLKRARVLEALYGSAGFHRDRFASLNGY